MAHSVSLTVQTRWMQAAAISLFNVRDYIQSYYIQRNVYVIISSSNYFSNYFLKRIEFFDRLKYNNKQISYI